MSQSVRRLVEQFQPEHYQLELKIDEKADSFQGTVKIRGKKVGRPSQRLTFHQKGLKITLARVMKHDKKGDTELPVQRVNHHAAYDEVRVHTQGKVFPGQYSVYLQFEGKITRPMNGIYPCFFTHNGKQRKLVATQFESHHAREAFPCIDEPEAKATFDLALVTPSSNSKTVLANTPARWSEDKDGWVTTIFEPTPRMSTYLVAFVYGELDYLEAKTKDGVTVRTYATPGQAEHGRHGLDIAVRALEFFSDYFGLPYPLPKLDMVALPDFSSGAMENWGLVTYRETTMLVDDANSSIESKQLVALVIAHELSHQWFGNLVTMKWWDDLWLNESFANLMEYRAVDALYPEWNIWEQFVSSEGVSAKRRDSLADVQPIRTGVRHPDEISTLFDPSIVYAKGGTVLYMLKNYIGEEAFRSGLKQYFEQHKYGNTEAKDLWQALGAAAGQDITGFMEGWLVRPGFPLVSTDWQPASGSLRLTQQRFLSDPEAAVPDSAPWQVPLAATVELDKPLLAKSEDTFALTGQVDTLLLNHDGQSYFVPHYRDTAHRQAIMSAIAHDAVSNIDRLLLLDNYNLLQRGGVARTTELLDLLQAYRHERNENVWGSMSLAFGEVRRLVEQDACEEELDKLIAGLTGPLAKELGWEDKPADNAQTLHLRGLVFSLAAGAKNRAVIDEGLQRFAGFKKPADLPPSTRSVIYFIGGRYGTEADFQKLLKLHEDTPNAEEKDELASGLTATKSAQQITHLLGMLTTDAIRRQDLMHWFVWLLRNRYGREAAWHWLTGHWDWIEREFASDKSYSFFARYCGSIFSRQPELKKFQEFFGPKKDVIALARDIMLAEQEIKSRVAWRARNEQSVKAWLGQAG